MIYMARSESARGFSAGRASRRCRRWLEDRRIPDNRGGQPTDLHGRLRVFRRRGGRAVCGRGAFRAAAGQEKPPEKYPWLTQLLARRPFKVVAIALANKMARVAWALLARSGSYRAPVLATP
jgi:transposase